MSLSWYRDGTTLATVGPGVSGETTSLSTVSIIGGAPRKLRDDVGRATISPDGAHIAYIGGRAQNEIWVMGANGENPKRLLQSAPGDHLLQIQWSPDGGRIAYIKSRSNDVTSESAIEEMPLNGGIGNTIFTAPALSSFCWSSDGRIIFSMPEPPPNDHDMNLWELTPGRPQPTASRPQRITSWAGLSLLDLSISADGKHLVFVNAGLQTDIQVAGLDSKRALGLPRRFTLQGRNNLPSAWTPDGQTLFFSSDRNGTWDIFKQRLLERSAQDFVLGPGDQTEPRLSPDASSVLYWDYGGTGSGTSPSIRLMRVPIAGGAPELVLEASRGATVRCALGHPPCVLSELDKANGELVFANFDPLRGKTTELIRLAADPNGSPTWDLSPDGSTVAIVDLDEQKGRIRLVELDSGSAHSVAVDPSEHLSGISWSADGRGWFVTSTSPGGATLFHIGLDRSISKLWTTNTKLLMPLASPDSRSLAFSTSTYNSNVWVIENF